MGKKITFEYVKNFISKESELISTTYKNSIELLLIKCNICMEIYKQNFCRYKRGRRHQICSNKLNSLKALKNRNDAKNYLKDSIRICILCNQEYNPKRSVQKLCNKECAFKYTKTEEYKQKGILNSRKSLKNDTKIFIKESIKICILCNKEYTPKRSRQKLCNKECAFKYTKTEEFRQKCRIKGGTLSAEVQQRRSKNEIALSNLCIDYFGKNDIICNERIFKDKNGNFWDCDIFIKSLKTAILWDGWYFHHGPNVSNKQKSRDKLKRKIILDNDCLYYTVLDKGKFNINFVRNEFDLFIHKTKFKNVLKILVNIY